MNKYNFLALSAIICLCLNFSTAIAAEPTRYDRRWVYLAQNLQVDENVEKVLALVDRAAKAGYNGIVLADYKFNVLDRVTDRYPGNVKRVADLARRRGIEIIPTVFPIGYSAGLLAHDPNLAEGVPVVAAPFRIERGRAILVPDPAATIPNGDLEKTRGDRFDEFSYQDKPGVLTFADRRIFARGSVSCRMEGFAPGGENGRLVRNVSVRPYACYRLSCRVKTDRLETNDGFRLLALGRGEGSPSLTFTDKLVEPTQDWKRVSVVFNSLDQKEIAIYAGVWGGRSGKIWIDDIELKELSLVNVLRRAGCPLVVAAAGGGVKYQEGRDYKPVVDPRLGVVPYAGEYDFDHDGAPIELTPNSRIKTGERLLVSWYHPILIHGNQVACCLSEPKVYDLLKDQAIRIHKLLDPKTYFMSHDELRTANRCRACVDRRLTAGELLADNVKRCVAILKEIDRDAKIVVWSDMFDPHHNAVDHYYLVNGSLKGSWEGLPAEVIIADWNSGKAAESLKFFAARGHKPILAGYYDGDMTSFQTWDAAARNVSKVYGFMYTTWENKYDRLEEYGKALSGAR